MTRSHPAPSRSLLLALRVLGAVLLAASPDPRDRIRSG
jgi:hypothetical protein